MNLSKIAITTVIIGALSITSCQRTEQLIQNTQDQPQHGQIIPGKYIVTLQAELLPQSKFKTNISYEDKVSTVRIEVMDIEKQILGKTTEIEHAYYTGFFGFAGPLTKSDIEILKKDPRVLNIEPDKFVALAPPPGKGKPDKGDGGDGGDGGTSSQTLPWGVERVNGGVTPSEGKIAWILDSGIDQDHPDLNVNTSLSKSFLTGKGSNSADDDNGHGTHVAGTVAALDNGFGVIGVAAGAEVVAVRVLDRRGNGTLSGVIAGVQYVADNADNNDVANMSLGGGISTSLDNAVLAASNTCTFVLAAGNESDDANNHSPARVGDQSSRIHTISAMNIYGNFAGFSNYGSDVDYCQPGTSIESCWKNGGYNTISGTSMAAPHMAGLVLIGYTTDGTSVNGDPDGNADLIPFHN